MDKYDMEAEFKSRVCDFIENIIYQGTYTDGPGSLEYLMDIVIDELNFRWKKSQTDNSNNSELNYASQHFELRRDFETVTQIPVQDGDYLHTKPTWDYVIWLEDKLINGGN